METASALENSQIISYDFDSLVSEIDNYQNPLSGASSSTLEENSNVVIIDNFSDFSDDEKDGQKIDNDIKNVIKNDINNIVKPGIYVDKEKVDEILDNPSVSVSSEETEECSE